MLSGSAEYLSDLSDDQLPGLGRGRAVVRPASPGSSSRIRQDAGSATRIHHLSNRSPGCRPPVRYDAASAVEAATVKHSQDFELISLSLSLSLSVSLTRGLM